MLAFEEVRCDVDVTRESSAERIGAQQLNSSNGRSVSVYVRLRRIARCEISRSRGGNEQHHDALHIKPTHRPSTHAYCERFKSPLTSPTSVNRLESV